MRFRLPTYLPAFFFLHNISNICYKICNAYVSYLNLTFTVAPAKKNRT